MRPIDGRPRLGDVTRDVKCSSATTGPMHDIMRANGNSTQADRSGLVGPGRPDQKLTWWMQVESRKAIASVPLSVILHIGGNQPIGLSRLALGPQGWYTLEQKRPNFARHFSRLRPEAANPLLGTISLAPPLTLLAQVCCSEPLRSEAVLPREAAPVPRASGCTRSGRS